LAAGARPGTARRHHVDSVPLLSLSLLSGYTELTGQPIEFTTGDAGVLIQRLKTEGANTPADMLITVDAGNLWHAAQNDVLSTVDSSVLNNNIPAHLRDEGNQWFGLSLRARTIVYSTQRVDPESLTTYEDLATDKWQGRLCLRTSKKVYNQSLVAMLIAEHGEEKTEEIVKGWISNLATDVFSNDTKVVEAIVSGQCDLGVVNTYYFGRLESTQPDIPAALFWPNQGSTGVHVNVAGAGITKHAKHPEQAQAFLEWLSQEEAQSMFAGENREFPANPAVESVPQVAAWGDFEASTLPLSKAGENQAAAVMLMDRSDYR
ncbi:MAG: extracellular solute-binding protein, partial [Pseudomonadota bacterium]